MVRNILTDKEREIINQYLNNNVKLEGYRVTLHRVHKLDLNTVENDLELIKKFMEV